MARHILSLLRVRFQLQSKKYNQEVQGSHCNPFSCEWRDVYKTYDLWHSDTAKQAWLKLKEEYEGDLKARRVQVLNLRREFEMLRMKDGESVREFADMVMGVVNWVHLLGEELTNQRVVEKVLVNLPERFEHKIASFEDSKDLTIMSIGELVSFLQAMEQGQNMKRE